MKETVFIFIRFKFVARKFLFRFQRKYMLMIALGIISFIAVAGGLLHSHSAAL